MKIAPTTPNPKTLDTYAHCTSHPPLHAPLNSHTITHPTIMTFSLALLDMLNPPNGPMHA